MVVIFEFCLSAYSQTVSVIELTFASNIIKDTYIEILSITHLVIQDDLPFEVKDRDMGPIECDSGLVAPCAPSVEDARHDRLYKWQ
jgi:hypothetical protein